MISRRILRTKVLQVFYSNCKSDKSMGDSEIELKHSIERGSDLFFLILDLIIEVGEYWDSQIEINDAKNFPDTENLGFKYKFSENIVIQEIVSNKFINDEFENRKINWANDRTFIKILYTSLFNSENVKNEIAGKKEKIDRDKNIVLDFLKNTVANSDELYDILEEKSIYWNVEIDYLIHFISKFVKSLKKTSADNNPLWDENKVQEDIEFSKLLLRAAIRNYEKYTDLISYHTRNWDVDRIAFMDILIIHLAINEIVEFKNIPKKVSFNEYIDISKVFSNQNSANFVNGILDAIVIKLEAENKITKSGRGLIDQSKKNIQ